MSRPDPKGPSRYPSEDLPALLGEAFDKGGLTALEATMQVLSRRRRHRSALRLVTGIYARLTEEIAREATATKGSRP